MGVWLELLCVAALADSRVLLVSIDGLGYKNLTQDPAARELTSLHKLARQGVLAPLQTTFPSKTAAGHAALFTGAWSGVNGIFSNTNPRTPRSAYALTDTITGFRSESLSAETLWAAAARQGASAVAYQATQLFPFEEKSTGKAGVVNGYQTWMIAPHRVIRQNDTKELSPGVYQWTDGPLVLRLERSAAGLTVSSPAGKVWVRAEKLESAPPRKRPLARRFSEVLPVEANGIRTGVYLRLFEYSPSDFLLYRTSAQELGVSGIPDGILAVEGAFVGNSAVSLYERGQFGRRLVEGGDGTAEKRYLETLELVVRQMTKHMARLDSEIKPRLLVGYYPVIDDLEHLWFGWSATGVRGVLQYRAWGYAALDEGLKRLIKRFNKDSILFTSDHGMAANTHEVRMGTLLAELGFAKDQVIPNASCIFVNTTDWKNGVVPSDKRQQLVDTLTQKLSETGLFTRFVGKDELTGSFGLRGGNSPDLCFDLKPLHYPTESAQRPAVSPYSFPRGEHGFDPTRADMESYLAVAGKGIRKGLPVSSRWRAVDVAAIAASLLGISPPQNSEGRIPPNLLSPSAVPSIPTKP